MYFSGTADLKSAKTKRKQIRTMEENKILNFLSKEDVITNYILIRLILSDSRFMLPRPIL